MSSRDEGKTRTHVVNLHAVRSPIRDYEICTKTKQYITVSRKHDDFSNKVYNNIREKKTIQKSKLYNAYFDNYYYCRKTATFHYCSGRLPVEYYNIILSFFLGLSIISFVQNRNKRTGKRVNIVDGQLILIKFNIVLVSGDEI